MKNLYTPPVTTIIAYCFQPLMAASPQYNNILNMESDEENTPNIFDYGNKGNAEDARAKENNDLWD